MFKYLVSFSITNPAASYWLRFPILVLVLVLSIVYVSIFGFSFKSFSNVVQWEEEQVEREVRKLSQQRKNELPPGEELSEDDKLELKELERLQKKWYDYDDFCMTLFCSIINLINSSFQ